MRRIYREQVTSVTVEGCSDDISLRANLEVSIVYISIATVPWTKRPIQLNSGSLQKMSSAEENTFMLPCFVHRGSFD